MITVIIGDDNKEHTITTQQYQVGLYVIIDNDPAQQGCLDVEEKEFHKKIREDYKYIEDKSSKL